MNGETDPWWLLVAVVTGAFATAMVVYGIRQKEPLPLVFGIAIGGVPMVVSTGWAAAVLSVAIGALFMVVRRYR